MTTTTVEKQYIHNLETGKIELHFSKDEYMSLTAEQKAELKRFFLFSRYASAWVSRSKNNHYMAIQTAEKLGFSKGGTVGERLSYAEEMQRKAEKAEKRAERYEQYAENAEHRAERLQSEFNENKKDLSWLTQPNVNSARGRAFSRQRDRVLDRYRKGFDEYRKSQYFKERAETARMTADQTQLNSRSYLSNRIEECNKNIRALERNIVRAEETKNDEWLERLLDRIEYEIDKLAYFENCLDELGGVRYNRDNLKIGYMVKIKGIWRTVVKTNPKTVYVKSEHASYALDYRYAEIQDMKIPENWTEQTNDIENPFQVDDILTETHMSGNGKIVGAYQVIKVTPKNITIQKINVEDNRPILNSFAEEKQVRKKVRKDRNNNFAVDGTWSSLYKYTG